MCLKRLLGRTPYNQEEEIAWSVQIATLGWSNFVDALLDSEEYTVNFGDSVVPYQRKRMTDRPFSFTPRYGADYRDSLPEAKPYVSGSRFNLNLNEPFELQTFVRTTNWGRAAGVILLLFLLCAITLLVGNLPTTGS
jgi:phycobilisome rod-core linker protein